MAASSYDTIFDRLMAYDIVIPVRGEEATVAAHNLRILPPDSPPRPAPQMSDPD